MVHIVFVLKAIAGLYHENIFDNNSEGEKGLLCVSVHGLSQNHIHEICIQKVSWHGRLTCLDLTIARALLQEVGMYTFYFLQVHTPFTQS